MTDTPDLAVLVASGRELLARDEIGRPVAIHGSGCPDDLTVNLWDIHHTLLMDSMSPGEANEIAWWLNNGPALLDAAERAQERAEAAERERDAYRKAKAENDERFMIERDEARQDRDAAWAALRQIATACYCWSDATRIAAAALLRETHPQSPQDAIPGPEAGGGV